MKKNATVLLLGLAMAGGASAKDQVVGGYTKKDGTYVAPHVQTSPNATKVDNYSTKGNVNPYTGKEGTVDPYKVPILRDARPLK
jgi:hypothetical protein